MMMIALSMKKDNDQIVLNVKKCQVPCETPDIVSSCDSGEGSKRNSLELDTESFGILRLEKGNLGRE